MENAIALPTTVADIVAEYDEKREALANRVQAVKDAFGELETGATVQGTYVEPITRNGLYLDERHLQSNLLKSGWKAIYQRLDIERIASPKDRQLFERTLQDPPPLTFENAVSTFEDYIRNMRSHILKGLAEVFCDLDPAYRSHSKVKIGVSGLPKRVILSNFSGWHGYGHDRFQSIVNALASLRGQPLMTGEEWAAVRVMTDRYQDCALDGSSYASRDDKPLATHRRGITVRRFKNGNAHVFFDKDALTAINRGLAEFYGDVLPDAEEKGAKPRASTAVAKDLQFYWTPRPVIERLLDAAGISKGMREPLTVLEPSCGDGRILDVLREYGCKSLGIEVHAGRAAQARAKGHPVQLANFLDVTPEPIFDRVVMNPPFYGKHYAKHVRHALRFLKPGGILVAVLPATAHYDHDAFADLWSSWRDLPVASFAEAGTNVPTGIITMRAPEAAASQRAA